MDGVGLDNNAHGIVSSAGVAPRGVKIAVEGVHGIAGGGAAREAVVASTGAADNVAEAPKGAAMTSTEEACGVECSTVLSSTEVEFTAEGVELTILAAISSGATIGVGVSICCAGVASGSMRISACARSSTTPPADTVLVMAEGFTEDVAGCTAAVSMLGAAGTGVTALETGGLGPGERDLMAMFGASPLLDAAVATCFVLEIPLLEVLATDLCFFAAFGGPILIGRDCAAEVDLVSATETELELDTAAAL